MYQIYLTGSRKKIHRAVRSSGGKFYITYYGNQIEVLPGTYGFYTKEKY